MSDDGAAGLVAAIVAAVPAWLELERRHRGHAAVVSRRDAWQALTGATEEGLFARHSLLMRAAGAVVRRICGGDEEVGFAGWPEEVGGAGLVAEVQGAVDGFAWDRVEHDVLREVYMAVLAAEVRKRGGEYYTPDWLAVRMVEQVVTRPLEQVVMDPSCGSGTFLFHAVRRVLAAADAAGMSAAEGVARAEGRVIGMDVHPVAVALARATVAAALGEARVRAARLDASGEAVIGAGEGAGGEATSRVGRVAMDGVRLPRVRCGDAIGWDGVEATSCADVLLGNPPWLAYRFMPAEMQAAFHRLCVMHGLWVGGTVSTHQDLAGLFVVRAVRRYLREGGRFAFVMPGAVLDRGQFAGLRGQRDAGLKIEECWDLRRVRPHPFPVGAAVIFNERSGSGGEAGLRVSEVWSGRPPAGLVRTTVGANDGLVIEEGRSPYHASFRQGATLVPRMLVMVERSNAGRVRSLRSGYEKRPWRGLASLEGEVEAGCLRPVLLGEHVMPYGLLGSALAVLPDAEGERGPGFVRWWGEAESLWLRHRSSEKLSLYGQLNYQQKLAGQSPGAALRVVYTKSGMHLAAAKLTDARAVVDHTLYWAAVGSEAEADFLIAILNAAVVTRMVRPLMAFGKDERHIDKQVWRLPIPRYDPGCALHGRLVAAGRAAAAELVGWRTDGRCVAVRREVRGYLAGSAVGRAIEGLVEAVLAQGSC